MAGFTEKQIMVGFINGIFPEQPYQFLNGMKTIDMDNQHKEGNHYVPGTAIPEPWASMYFS